MNPVILLGSIYRHLELDFPQKTFKFTEFIVEIPKNSHKSYKVIHKSKILPKNDKTLYRISIQMSTIKW